jgi:hypothetical protein
MSVQGIPEAQTQKEVPAVGQEQKTQVATPAAAGETEQKSPSTDEMRSKFAALAKKERMARLAQANIKSREQQLIDRERQIAERERLWNEEFKQSPLEAIKKRGYTYEDITKAALNDGKFEPATEIKSVKEEIERIKQEASEREKKQLEAQQSAVAQAEQEAIDSFKDKITKSIEENKDKYELTQILEASELVFQTVEEHFNRTKKILSINEACDLVEQYLESEVERTAQNSKKFQSKYGSMKQKVEEPKGKPKSDVTLSNELTSTAPSLLPSHTENDRIKRALAALG